MIQTTRTPKEVINLEVSRVTQAVSAALEEVASTRSRSSSKLVDGEVGSHSGMDTDTDERYSMLDVRDARPFHDSLDETEDGYGLEWLLSLYHYILLVFSTSFAMRKEKERC